MSPTRKHGRGTGASSNADAIQQCQALTKLSHNAEGNQTAARHSASSPLGVHQKRSGLSRTALPAKSA